MGDDGEETLSSSNVDKTSPEEGADEERRDPIEEERLNGGEPNDAAEQREFLPESADSNVSPSDANDGEGLVGNKEEEVGDMHGAGDVEGKEMEAKAEVGGGGEGPVLTKKVGGEDSDFIGVDVAVTNEETPVPVVSVQAAQVVANEEVKGAVETEEFKEDSSAITGVVREENDSVVAVIVGEKTHEMVFDELETVVQGEKLSTESADASGVEEGEEMAAKTVRMTGAEQELDESGGRKTTAEEMIPAAVESKVDAVAVIETIKDESDAEMDHDIKGTEEFDNFGSNDLQNNNGQQSVLLVDEKANEEFLQTEAEAMNVSTNVESLSEPVDTGFIRQGDGKGVDIVAEEEGGVADMRMETEAHVFDEMKELGINKQAKTKTVEFDVVHSILSTDDAEFVSQDEDKLIIAKDEPDLSGSEMKNKPDAGEESRVLILQHGEEAETNIREVADVVSTPMTDDAEQALSDEGDREMVTEDGSALAGTEMDTETETGEEKIMLEKEEDVEREFAGVDNVEGMPEVDDTDNFPKTEGDEEMAAEESAMVDTEETETDVGESSRVVGEKNKRGKNAIASPKSKTSSKAQKVMEEDVCFICFDGGDLFLCDRR